VADISDNIDSSQFLLGRLRMAYDEALAERARSVLGKSKRISEKKMFGGICFLLDGKMIGGVLKNDLIVKVGAHHHDKAIARKHVRAFDFTGKPMAGIVYVERAGVNTARQLAAWLEMGRANAESVLAKKKK
jgi:TfoX/Sxy family transcriptional regulator of competence genes